MALVCLLQSRECDGCQECQRAPQAIGVCAACGDDIYEDEDHYEIDGELVHEDCLELWAGEYKVVGR